MDFSFNQDQLLIADSADTFLSAVSGSQAVRASMSSDPGFDEQLWHRITQEMGWQLTHLPERYDGLGLGYVELCILLERMGQNLLCAPFFSSVCLGVNALLIAGSEQQKQQYLPQCASGELRCSLGYSDSNGRGLGAAFTMAAEGAVLNGDCHYVVDGHTADQLIIAAQQADGGVGLFLITPDSVGVDRRWTASLDQTRSLAEVSLRDVLVKPDAIMLNPSSARPLLDNILSLAVIGLAAEQLGVADRALSMTVEYISERKQFGRAVGSFQAMKHKAADMLNKAEAARSAVYYAACIADEFFQGAELGSELHEAASIAKAYCCDAAFFNTGSALQMHGGVGFTWEYDVHLYFKRAKSAQLMFADSAWHRERVASILLGEAR